MTTSEILRAAKARIDTPDKWVTPATTPAAPTRIDVLEHAKEIALQQGAVTNYLRFWEGEDGSSLANPTRATLADYRHCRVCVSGAAVLAALRLGYDDGPDGKYEWLGDAHVAMGVDRDGGDEDWLEKIEDDPHEVVRILDMMIARERARQPAPVAA